MASEAAYEKTDVHGTRIAGMAAVLVGVLIATAFFIMLLVAVWDTPRGGSGIPPPREKPQPPLSAAPSAERAQYNVEKRRLLGA